MSCVPFQHNPDKEVEVETMRVQRGEHLVEEPTAGGIEGQKILIKGHLVRVLIEHDVRMVLEDGENEDVVLTEHEESRAVEEVSN